MKIVLDGAALSPSTISNHITYRSYDYKGQGASYCNRWNELGECIGTTSDPIYEWTNHTTSAVVNGTVKSSVTNVKIEGKSPVVLGSSTSETDSYSLPSGGVYVSGQHTNSTSGAVTKGNASNVYVNGKLLATSDASIVNHGGVGASVSSGFSSSVNIG